MRRGIRSLAANIRTTIANLEFGRMLMPIRFVNKLAALLVAGAALSFSGCKKEEIPPQPAPSATKTPAPTASAPTEKAADAPAKPAAPAEKSSEPAPKNDGGGPVLTPPATSSGESKSDSK